LARGRLLGGRHPEGSCGARFQARERGERRAKARSVRAARAELRPRETRRSRTSRTVDPYKPIVLEDGDMRKKALCRP